MSVSKSKGFRAREIAAMRRTHVGPLSGPPCCTKRIYYMDSLLRGHFCGAMCQLHTTAADGDRVQKVWGYHEVPQRGCCGLDSGRQSASHGVSLGSSEGAGYTKGTLREHMLLITCGGWVEIAVHETFTDAACRHQLCNESPQIINARPSMIAMDGQYSGNVTLAADSPCDVRY
jgi:hypothetical protein